MRLIKILLSIACLFLLGLIFYWVQQVDEESQVVKWEDQLAVSSQGDSIIRQVELDTQSIKEPKTVGTLFQDYEVHMEKDIFYMSKGNQIVSKEKLANMTVKQILLSDLNENDAPECWILGEKLNHQTDIRVFEYKSGHLNRIIFPKLKGSQAIGYAGADSIYLDKTGIVRQFNFANDPYADLSSGKRACYYQFGKDQSFILKKTIDLE